MKINNNHMKTIIKTIACLGVLGLAASCQQFEIDTQMTPEKAAASIRMVCDALPSYTVAATNPGTVTFNVSSNTPWTITRSSGADWCTVTPSSSSAGALISDVVVSFEPNTAREDRTATLTLKGDKVGLPVTIQITQSRQGQLFVTPVVQDYAATGGPLTFTIQTNMAWEVRSSEGWLTFNRESGEPDPDGRTLTIIATAAPSDVLERVATVTVTAGVEEESFEVTQKGKFELSEISGPFSGAGETKTLKLRTDLPWEVNCDKDWITFDKESGVGDGSSLDIKVTAAPNDGMERNATVKVTVGGVEKTFEVSQSGAVFEIVAPASTEVDSHGQEITLAVNSSLAWEPSTDVDGWTVKKTDDSHFLLTVPFNNKFVAKKGNVTIKGPNGAEASVEMTQSCAFEFEGNYVIQDDGSVKLIGDATSRVVLKDGMRYGTMDITLGDVSFAASGNLWFENHTSGDGWGAQLYNWCVVGKTRLRAEGNVAGGKSMNAEGTSYMSSSYDLSETEFNAMTGYKMTLAPNAENPSLLDMTFVYNNEDAPRAQATCQNPFYGNDVVGKTFFGFHSAATADSWYVVKRCDVTFLTE